MYRGLHGTDSGMHCIWDPAAFSDVVDYDTWARKLEKDRDIMAIIAAGTFVPLNIGNDGGMEVELRVGTPGNLASLNERESKYLIVQSEPYRFKSSGTVCISGVEHVAADMTANIGSCDIPPGEYAAVVHLLAWDEEPGMQTDEGPAAGALPDYLVILNPISEPQRFRTEVRTF